jgi:predicted phosphoribosyltransferase
MGTRFKNREEAGRAVANRLTHYAGRDAVVLALPRGGVPIGFEVAKRLKVPLDIFLVRKLGMPGHKEFAIGAIASGGVFLLNDRLVEQINLSGEVIGQIVEEEREELERRERVYRSSRHAVSMTGRIVILTDDGLATGLSMKAAVQAVRQRDPAQRVVAVPVAPAEVEEEFKNIADEVVCVYAPGSFFCRGRMV